MNKLELFRGDTNQGDRTVSSDKNQLFIFSSLRACPIIVFYFYIGDGRLNPP